MRQKTAQLHFILLATSEYACSISWSAGHVFVNSSRAYALFKYLQMPVISEGNSKSLYLLATIWKRRGNSQKGKTHKRRQLYQTIHSSEACTIFLLKFPWHLQPFKLPKSQCEFAGGTLSVGLKTEVLHNCAHLFITDGPRDPLAWICSIVQSLSQVQLFHEPMDCSPSGSSVHEISLARILEWVTISFCRGSSWPRDWTQICCTSGQILYHLSRQESPELAL